MTMKAFPWKCGECRERAVTPVTLPAYATELEHDGRKYQITLADFAVALQELRYDNARRRGKSTTQ